ncbi:helix-turn-helix domain-containing protein [Novispirillum sp. DQ9]|uniref:helix-turn-helix domain-containing protein n=1 Tax=Novispirillum sp. DQ9 TaxID=3398612 RepID=UPI003C7EB34E
MPAPATPAHPVDLHIGSRIRLRRVLLGLSQQQVAGAVGVTFQQIQKYESGANRISAARLYDIARALGVPPMFFVDDLEPSAGADADAGGLTESDPMQRTETLELVRTYWKLGNEDLRKCVLDLLHAMGSRE